MKYYFNQADKALEDISDRRREEVENLTLRQEVIMCVVGVGGASTGATRS